MSVRSLINAEVATHLSKPNRWFCDSVQLDPYDTQRRAQQGWVVKQGCFHGLTCLCSYIGGSAPFKQASLLLEGQTHVSVLLANMRLFLRYAVLGSRVACFTSQQVALDHQPQPHQPATWLSSFVALPRGMSVCSLWMCCLPTRLARKCMAPWCADMLDESTAQIGRSFWVW